MPEDKFKVQSVKSRLRRGRSTESACKAKNNSTGFTLVELLITIMIIGVLAAIGLFTYSAVLKQGRDSKRMADLRAIQSALEQYYSDQGFYPNDGYGPIFGLDFYLGNIPGSVFTNETGNPDYSSPSKTYINSLPQDPTGSVRYRYEPSPASCDNDGLSDCTGYCLYAQLENSNPGRPSGCSNEGYNFALTPP